MSAPESRTSVFINCPFDPAYRAIFEAILFAIHDCGFQARCALAEADSGQVRIEKIYTLIRQCDLGVHDLSRVELDHHSGLPRFNMPFELGIFLGAKHFGSAKQKSKRCLILDSEAYRYQKFLSDIAGQDIRSHDNDPDQAIRCVRGWLNYDVPDGAILPSGEQIVARFRQFLGDLPILCRRLGFASDGLDYPDFMSFTAKWLEDNPRP